MQIGKFASLCGTKISVLRHYDREGLLVPEFVDRFTGYRYYSAAQKDVFLRITWLKNAGFSLSEIREIITNTHSDEGLISIIQKKKSELYGKLGKLNEVMKEVKKDKQEIEVYFKNTDSGIVAQTNRTDGNRFRLLCDEFEEELDTKGYQRISAYRSYGEPLSNEVYAECDVVKLTDEEMLPHDEIDLPFNDDNIIGKWEIVGEYAVEEDFYAEREYKHIVQDGTRCIYFLPQGERYWCFGWTCGILLFNNGWYSSAEKYHTVSYDGERYMFIEHKSYYYRHGGKPTALVLRQLDKKAYTKSEIARRDDIDMPYIPDPEVLGAWHAVGFCRTIESFDPEFTPIPELFFKRVEFREGGKLAADYGNRHVEEDFQTWTRGCILRHDNGTACAYEKRGKYLFIEWKSGDYIYGGMEPQYYVFEKEET